MLPFQYSFIVNCSFATPGFHMTAKLLAHGGKHFVREGVILAGTEPGE
jgi:hypothetical protein